MENNTKLKPRPTRPLSHPAPSSLVIALKRKGSSENGQKHFSPPSALPDTRQGEYNITCDSCEVCRTGVGFWDGETSGFTLEHLEAHRLTCPTPGQLSNGPVIQESTVETLAHPPTKRHRAKRTKEERIAYLRADPYVAKFEAYRVLCASCDKWIRLRSNSTYCPIPWDAHRKCCLVKKVKGKYVYALEERNTLFSKDPDIRKFDATRVLCSICDKWLGVNPDDHLQAVRKWLQHRAACQKTSTPTFPLNELTLPIGPGGGPSSCGVQTLLLRSVSPISPEPGPIFAEFAQNNQAQFRNHTSDHPSFHDYDPFNYVHESRRRSAQKRAETPRTDSQISEVEPNHVPLCQEQWAQLRQDSSYRARPWLQHHGKRPAKYSDKPSFQPSRANLNGHSDSNQAVGNIQKSPTTTVENTIYEDNYYLTVTEDTSKPTATNVYNEEITQGISEGGLSFANYHMSAYRVANDHTLTSTYNPKLQTLFENNMRSSYHPGDPAVDSTVQSPTVAVEVPASTYYVTHDENTNRPIFSNAHTAQDISESSLADVNHLFPVSGVGNGHILTNTHNPELQPLFSGVNNMESTYYPDNPAIGSVAQSPTVAVGVPASAKYYIAPGENTNMYSLVFGDNTVNLSCNFSGCHYVSRSKRDMVRHCSNLRHGGGREHKCEYCGKIFVRRDTLSRHVKETSCRLRQVLVVD